MPAFEYKALDAKGKTKKGLLEADTAKQVRNNLREKGLTPLEVNVAAEQEKKQGSSFFKTKVSTADLSLITRQLATLIQ